MVKARTVRAFALLSIFLTSLFAGALAQACPYSTPAMAAGMAVTRLSCCDTMPGCAGSGCTSSHARACADHASPAILVKASNTNVDTPKLLPSAFAATMLSPSRAPSASDVRPLPRNVVQRSLIGYRAAYARTGRLLI